MDNTNSVDPQQVISNLAIKIANLEVENATLLAKIKGGNGNGEQDTKS